MLMASRATVSSTGSDHGVVSPDDASEGVLSSRFLRMYNKHRGKNCLVMEAWDRKAACNVVIKAFNKAGMTETSKERIQREVELLQVASEARVPNVMRFLGALEDDGCLYTIAELCPGTTLIELMADRGGRLSHRRCAMSLARPLLMALSGLHACKIVHRHLRPEHLIIYSKSRDGRPTYPGRNCSQAGSHHHQHQHWQQSGADAILETSSDVEIPPMCNLKLVDFMDAAMVGRHPLISRVGDMLYMAPEVLRSARADEIFHQVLVYGMSEDEIPQYDEKVDVWSFGVIVYEALTGQQPFVGDTAKEMLEEQQRKLWSTERLSPETKGLPTFLATHARLPSQAAHMLSSIFVEDPSCRPSAKELLRHPWLSQEEEP